MWAKKNNAFIVIILISFIFFLHPSVVFAKQLKPFHLAAIVDGGNFDQVLESTREKLAQAGFKIIGEQTPYDGAVVVVFTNEALLNNASATEYGGFGAVQRVSVTQVGTEIQVAFTNPVYMAYAYRLADKLESIEQILKKALGYVRSFGSQDGLSPEDLENYHYMFGMPYFSDLITLNKYLSFNEAVKKTRAALAEKKAGAYQVYFQEIPGKQQVIVGVGMTQNSSGDKEIMQEIDFKPLKSTAHLPYEMLIHENGGVYILSPKFRIAINFSDLEMVGKNSFVGIMNSPAAIRDTLIEASGGEVYRVEDEF
jgi:hypothetical protein